MAGMQESIVTALNGFFHDFADPDGDPPGIPLSRFCSFLAYGRLISSDFDHSHVLEVFLEATGGDGDASMDTQSFRAALQTMASRIYADQLFGGSHKAAHEPALRMVALQELLRDIALRREGGRDQRSSSAGQHTGDLKGLLYDLHMIHAAYAYADSIARLFARYAAGGGSSSSHSGSKRRASTFSRFGEPDPGLVGGRSAYRLCRASGLVPDFVVAGELVDVARELALMRTGHLFPAEHRYFDEEQMTSCPEDSDWTVPETAKLSGEQQYNFPQLMELLVAAALWMPPRVHLEPVRVRVRRIHEVFARCFGPPAPRLASLMPRSGGGEDNVAAAGAGAVPAWSAALEHTRLPEQLDGELAEEAPLELEAVLSRLREDLPKLPPPQGPRLPEPPAAATAALPKPPQTKEEKIEEAQKALVLQLKGYRVPKAGGSATTGRKKKTAKGKKKAEPAFVPPGELDKVTWYARPTPVLLRGMVPPEHREVRRTEQMELFQSGLDRRRRQIDGFTCPVTGWVLRMGLIDEPLRAPHCPSEEVFTLIETAITSRRLRHYDTAASMLIEARRLWAVHESGGPTASGVPLIASEHRASTSSACDLAGMPQTAREHRASVTSACSFATSQEAWPEPRRSADDGCGLPVGSQMRAGGRSSCGSMSARGEAVAEGGLAHRRYRADADFAQALGHLDEGCLRLPPEAGLFFLCELASLHSAMHEDELALRLLWRARLYSDRLPARHPDTAAVWCATCRAAYYAGHHDIAARAAARARVIREETLGEDTVETATVYNNLACCLAALERPLEALAYLEVSAEILRELAGEEHPRTQTALRNLDKARSSQKHLSMQSPHLFSFPVKAGLEVAKRGRKKKKKLRRSGSRSSSRRSSASKSSKGSRRSSRSKK